MIANYPVDPDAIGAAGISYGSGIALIGAAKDPRIKAVSAMSSWGSLYESLYGNKTPRLVWGELLDLSSGLLGRPDPNIKQYWQAIRDQNQSLIPEVTAWAAVRSPDHYIQELNANGTAVYLLKAYGDDLFQPNSLMKMFEQLTGPKHIDLVPGTHATADLLPPLLGQADTLAWHNTHAWFDLHLKGQSNALATAKPINMKVKFSSTYNSYDHFPIPEASTKTFYLHPRNALDNGDLETYKFSSLFSFTNQINSWAGTSFDTGFPLLSQLLEQIEVPVITNIPSQSDVRSIYWNSGILTNGMKVRGNPSVTLQIKPLYNQIQLVGYLYDMDALGNGKLMTHGVITLPQATSGQKTTVKFDMVTTAYDIPAGHRLVLAIDTQDPQYKTPTSTDYYVDFNYSTGAQSTLTVPAL